VRIVIAEDDALLREGLALLLRAESLDVVATAGTPEEFLAAIDEHKPDVAIVDVRMPPTHTDEGVVAAVEGRVEEFLEALRRVANGGTAIDPEVVAQLFARTRPDARLERLSPREKEVLALMAEGLGNLAIAERLFVTEGAVHKHIRAIFAKLDLAPADGTDRRVAAVLHYLDGR
jgi:DNA-binding NarL/FixJ family response regulator